MGENNKQVVIFAKITLKPEFFELAKEAILKIIPATLEEPGCKIFKLHENLNEQNSTLYLYEIFNDIESYNYHHQQEYTKYVFQLYKNWLADVEITKLFQLDTNCKNN